MKDKIAKGRQHFGVGTGGVVLDDAKIAAALKEFSLGETGVVALAGKYGVEESTMRAIINGKTWRHVVGPRLSRADIVAIGKRNRAAAIRLAKGIL